MWKEYFTFSGNERRGLILLTSIVLLLLVIRISMNYFSSSEEEDLSEIIAMVDSIKNELSIRDVSIDSFKKSVELFPFDPNIINYSEWVRLGLSEKQINTIKNYLSKGGRFRNRNDFYKIYGIPKKQADQLVPFIYITESIVSKDKIEESLPNTELTLVLFDPNSANDSLLLSLGFSKRVINTLLKYRRSGGKFYEKDDLRKIYGLDSVFYQKIEKFIVINDTIQKAEISDRKMDNYISVLELNSIDSIGLLKLPGIGPVFAGRIIKYRKILGGYVSVDQLIEVYGLKEDVLIKIKSGFSVDVSTISTVSLNFSSVDEFRKHPYLDKEDARTLAKFRSKNGNYTHVSQIIEEKLIDETTYQKIFPYLCLN